MKVFVLGPTTASGGRAITAITRSSSTCSYTCSSWDGPPTHNELMLPQLGLIRQASSSTKCYQKLPEKQRVMQKEDPSYLKMMMPKLLLKLI